MFFHCRNRVFNAGCHLGGGGALYSHLNDNSALFSASFQPQNLSTEEEKIAEEMQADLLAGTLELDPENDPVLGTTENGLEIKFHGVALTGEWDYTKFTTTYVTDKFTGSGTFYNLSGYLYITMGTYDGSAVNWVIIGRNSSLDAISATNTYAQCTTTITNFLKFSSYSTYASALNNQRETTTPAGSAINTEISKHIVNTVSDVSRSYTYNISSYGAPVASDEIPSGCVLCLSAKTLGSSGFVNADYSTSTLKSTINTLYSSGLGLTDAQKAQIQVQTLSTSRYDNEIFDISGQNLFPLAGASSSESYYVGRYLTSNTKRANGTTWWLRSCYRTYGMIVSDDGLLNNALAFNSTYGVRPAFVLSLA